MTRQIGPGDGVVLAALAFLLVIGFVMAPLVMTLILLCLLLGCIVAKIAQLAYWYRPSARNDIEASFWQPDELITYASVARTLDPEVVATIERWRDARPLNYTRQPVTVMPSETSTGRAVWVHDGSWTDEVIEVEQWRAARHYQAADLIMAALREDKAN